LIAAYLLQNRLIDYQGWREGRFLCALTAPNLFKHKLWYVLADYEEYIVLDQQLEERYANRRRARLGLAYRLNYKHRFELSYTLQSARNEIDDDLTRTDNVIQLRYKMFLNPSKVINK